MKKHSLTRQITSIVSILVAGAILLCWVLNTTLLPRYYMHNKKHVLMENYETISNASEQDKLESDEFTVTFDVLQRQYYDTDLATGWKSFTFFGQ